MTWTPLELAANIMTAICIFLAGRNSVHTWWTGIISSILFGVLFYTSQLYADATLQVFFIVTGAIGWYGWSKTSNAEPLPISSSTAKTLVGMLGIAVVTAALYGWLLHSFTNAYAPWIDSTVLTFSVVAQLLLMRRSVQNWHVWVLVNTLSVPLFWSRELYLTSILYGFFWVNAIVSLVHWKKLMKVQKV
jgi:nicotinamide mononucleotide transporter